MSDIKTSNSGWGAWQNIKKENESLKKQLSQQQTQQQIYQPSVEDEFFNNMIKKNKDEINSLIKETELKKKELENVILKYKEEFEVLEKENENKINILMRKNATYKDLINENEIIKKNLIPEIIVPKEKEGTKKSFNSFLMSEKNELFIGSLPDNYKEIDLYKLFSPFGEIIRCVILMENNLKSKNCGFVNFVNKDSAKTALNILNNTCPESFINPIKIEYSHTSRK
jgi:RNA recognition motif-containing protein